MHSGLNRQVARSHREQLKCNVNSPDEFLKRFELCTFLRLVKDASSDFTLVLAWEISKDFIRIFLDKHFAAMGFRVEIKENITKFRVEVKHISTVRES